jgi:hypothetical protein
LTRRRGRPPLDPSSKTIVVPFRMTERAYADVTERARVARLSFAEYMRRAARGATPHKRDFPTT